MAPKALTEVEEGLLKAGKFLIGLEGKATEVLNAGERVAPQIVEQIETTFTDLETFVSLAAAAVSGSGVNFPADSAVYAQLLKLIQDAKTMGTVFATAVAALKAA